MKLERARAVVLSALWEARPRGCIVLGRGGKAPSLPWGAFCARRDDAPVAAVLVLAAFAAPKAGRERRHPPAVGQGAGGGGCLVHTHLHSPPGHSPLQLDVGLVVTASVGAAGEAGP